MTIKQHYFTYDLLIPLIFFLSLSGWVLYRMLAVCGQVVYPIDDPYIHMAMARHLVEHGSYGVSLNGFSASSSSPLWTILTAFCFRILGVRDSVALALNIITSLVLLFTLHHILRQWISSRIFTLFILLFYILALPLVTHAFTGMEHPLHIVLLILLISKVIPSSSNQEINHKTISLLTVCAVLIRYESLFVIAPLCLITMMNRQWKRVLTLLVSAIVPVVMLGCLYVWMGWYFFPNSIMVKSAISSQDANWLYGILSRLYHQLYNTHHLAVLFLSAAAVFFWQVQKKDWMQDTKSCWLFMFLVSAILHCMFASIGWFYRYEGYLLTIGIIALSPFIAAVVQCVISAPSWITRLTQYAVCLVLSALLLAPFQDYILSIKKIVPGAKNIYEQQYQMGRFLKQYYEEEAVLANDIGAINYLADLYCLDIMGLGSMEPLKAAKQGRFNADFTEAWCQLKGADIAVIYAAWWNEDIPQTWQLAGTWTVTEKVTVSDQTVSFYALNPESVQPLVSNLIAYQNKLPNDVVIEYFNP